MTVLPGHWITRTSGNISTLEEHTDPAAPPPAQDPKAYSPSQLFLESCHYLGGNNHNQVTHLRQAVGHICTILATYSTMHCDTSKNSDVAADQACPHVILTLSFDASVSGMSFPNMYEVDSLQYFTW